MTTSDTDTMAAKATATAAKRAAYIEHLAGVELTRLNAAAIDKAAAKRAEAAKAAMTAAATAAERAAEATAKRAAAKAEATAKAAAEAAERAAKRAAERAAMVSIRAEVVTDIMAERAAARDLLDSLERMQYTLHPRHAAAVKTAAGDTFVAAMLGATEAEAAELAAEAAAVDMQALVTEAEESVSSGSQFGRFISPAAKAAFHSYRAEAGYKLAAEALSTLKDSAVVVSSTAAAAITVYATERAVSPEQYACRISGANGRLAMAAEAAAKAKAFGLTEAAAKASARATKAANSLETLKAEAAEAAAKPATGGMATWIIIPAAKRWTKALAAKAAKLAPAADNNGMRAVPSVSGKARMSDKTSRDGMAAAIATAKTGTMTAAERMRKMRAAKRAAEGVTVRAYNSATGTNAQAGRAKAPKTAMAAAMAEAVTVS